MINLNSLKVDCQIKVSKKTILLQHLNVPGGVIWCCGHCYHYGAVVTVITMVR